MHAFATTIATHSNLYIGGANIELANFRIGQIIYLLINAFCLVVLVNQSYTIQILKELGWSLNCHIVETIVIVLSLVCNCLHAHGYEMTNFHSLFR